MRLRRALAALALLASGAYFVFTLRRARTLLDVEPIAPPPPPPPPSVEAEPRLPPLPKSLPPTDLSALVGAYRDASLPPLRRAAALAAAGELVGSTRRARDFVKAGGLEPAVALLQRRPGAAAAGADRAERRRQGRLRAAAAHLLGAAAQNNPVFAASALAVGGGGEGGEGPDALGLLLAAAGDAARSERERSSSFFALSALLRAGVGGGSGQASRRAKARWDDALQLVGRVVRDEQSCPAGVVRKATAVAEGLLEAESMQSCERLRASLTDDPAALLARVGAWLTQDAAAQDLAGADKMLAWLRTLMALDARRRCKLGTRDLVRSHTAQGLRSWRRICAEDSDGGCDGFELDKFEIR